MSKVMTAFEAVDKFIFDGASIGISGMNVVGAPMAIAHEIVRQKKKNLTLLACNLSISADILIGAGLVKKCESGTCNIGWSRDTTCPITAEATHTGLMSGCCPLSSPAGGKGSPPSLK